MGKYMEKNRTVRMIEILILGLILLTSVIAYGYGFHRLHTLPGSFRYQGTLEMHRDASLEDYDEDSTVCDVVYVNGEKRLVVSYSYEKYMDLDSDSILAYVYEGNEGTVLCFDHRDPSQKEIETTYRQTKADQLMPLYNLANALLILAVSLGIMLFFSQFFSLYEKCWFLSIMVLATVFAVLFPEESANGVNGIVIMLLYLLDIFLNILCELLISKQSRYNFLVSVLVEICEIVICLVLMYRFATMATTLFFWLPIDIISFINWTRHKDEREEELTVVRRLKGYQEVLVILAIAVWTLVVGYLLSGLDISTDLFGGNRDLEVLVVYLDACASAVGIANGVFILLRMREQWIAWYICALLEAVINVLAGQYVLLVLKLGYFTNTTYGYIKWSRYIRSHKEEKASLF